MISLDSSQLHKHTCPMNTYAGHVTFVCLAVYPEVLMYDLLKTCFNSKCLLNNLLKDYDSCGKSTFKYIYSLTLENMLKVRPGGTGSSSLWSSEIQNVILSKKILLHNVCNCFHF